MQVASHAPQFAAEVLRLISQPFAAVASQSPKPVVHAKPQVPLVHEIVALARVGQAFMHPPQCEVLVLRLASQPSVRLLLQSPKPEAQVQRLSAHPPAEFIDPAAGHAAPEQPPQRAGVLVRSKQAL